MVKRLVKRPALPLYCFQDLFETLEIVVDVPPQLIERFFQFCQQSSIPRHDVASFGEGRDGKRGSQEAIANKDGCLRSLENPKCHV